MEVVRDPQRLEARRLGTSSLVDQRGCVVLLARQEVADQDRSPSGWSFAAAPIPTRGTSMRFARLECWVGEPVPDSMSDSIPLARPSGSVSAADWFLSAAELLAAAPQLDRDTSAVDPWTSGNQLRPLVHGVTYFRELLRVVDALGPGDLLLFADWRGDPEQQLDGPGTEVGDVFAAAATRGADVRGLIWRSHLDRFQFSAKENRHLGTAIEAAGGPCLLDMRVRPMGSHHQK